MKTRKNKLDFKKRTIAELNDAQMHDVNGGTLSLAVVSVLVVSPAFSTVLWRN